jgi:hypothetical protein
MREVLKNVTLYGCSSNVSVFRVCVGVDSCCDCEGREMRSVWVLRIVCEKPNGLEYTFEKEFAKKSDCVKFEKRFWLKKGHKKKGHFIEPEWRLF